MKYSGLYFIPNVSTNLDAALTTVSALVQGLETNFQNVSRQGTWSLFYRAFRDTLPPGYQPSNSADGKPQPFPHTYQHLLHLTALAQSRTFICTQPPGRPGTVTSIPARQQDMFAALVRHQSAALWTSRHVLSVQSGVSYSSGLCTIQIGEVRAIREGPQSGGAQSPGVVICISTVVGTEASEDDGNNPESSRTTQKNGTAMEVNGGTAIDFDYAEAVIRDCWAKIKEGRDLGRAEVREAMMAREDVNGTQEKDAAVRMWCNILRLRG